MWHFLGPHPTKQHISPAGHSWSLVQLGGGHICVHIILVKGEGSWGQPSEKQTELGFQMMTPKNWANQNMNVSKTCVMRPLSKIQKIDFQDQVSLNADQKYCRMLQGEHSAKHLTCIKLPLVIYIFVFVYFWVAAQDRFYCRFSNSDI